MGHVRGGHDDGASLAGGAAGVRRGVGVVDDGRDGEASVVDEAAKASLLVAGEGFGGIEVDGAGRGVAREGLEEREVKAEALAAGGGGGDDDVLAIHGRGEG